MTCEEGENGHDNDINKDYVDEVSVQPHVMHMVGTEEGSADDTSDAWNKDSEEHSVEGDCSGCVGGHVAAGNDADFRTDPRTDGIGTDSKQCAGYGCTSSVVTIA